jgi:hypothetical protein
MIFLLKKYRRKMSAILQTIPTNSRVELVEIKGDNRTNHTKTLLTQGIAPVATTTQFKKH